MAINVLIVDDSKTVRSVIAKSLKMAGIPMNEVYQAENGQEALDLVAEHWVDLILADINMPVMNGVEMIERLKGEEMSASIPILVVSSEGSEVRIAELMAKGIQGFVRKPFQPEELRDVVQQSMGELDE